MKFAIVQHSGAETGHAEFEQAVEAVMVSAADAKKVERAGGVVVDGYVEAEDLAERINFPETNPSWLIPKAQGAFSDVRADGLRVYLPVRAVVG